MSDYSSIFYKADQRETELQDDGHSLFTIQYKNLQQPLRRPFGDLLCLSDVFLLPGKEHLYKPHQDMQQLVLPLVGSFLYDDEDTKGHFIGVEELLFASTQKVFTIRNPHEEQINYLHIGLRADPGKITKVQSAQVGLREYNNLYSLQLDQVHTACSAYVGMFRGRTKSTYRLKNPQHGLFAYVINGAFEVEERLLEHRDGLARWNTEQIEFESLSEFAILLLIETPLYQIK